MIKKYFLLVIIFCYNPCLLAQYNMQDLTVYDCEGTLKDSESNGLNPSWYSHNENFNFTICPPNALQITITFTTFSTEPINDYLIIYDGPDNSYPVLSGPYSGSNLPPQINSNGCITIEFISDQNVAEEGFELTWETDVSIPSAPIINFPIQPTCSTNIFNIELDQSIHCDSVNTANIQVNGQINQSVNANPINCINDSTNIIELTITPGFNESGIYNVFFESFFTDDCNNIWNLSTSEQVVINDCPLEVDLYANNTTICMGECADLYVNVNGGDSTSYNYTWIPNWNNSPGVQTVCPTTTTQYIVIVDDNGVSLPTSDTITINVVNPPVAQNSISLCQTDPSISLTANPPGGTWSGDGIINSSSGLFSPNGLASGIYSINYNLGGCDDNLNVTVLEINAGPDISACVNSSTFNLNTNNTTPGGSWSGSSFIQTNGDISIGSTPTIIEAIYTMPNGCTDTLNVEVVNTISMPNSTTLCQQSGSHPLTFTPINGTWSVTPDNPIINSLCVNPILSFPHQEGWENGLNGWTHDPSNDFNWSINNGSTPSAGTGPQNSIEGLYYIYAEASNPNHPEKIASIVSPCINLSEYNNPVLHFNYHKYGAGQGSFAIDISTDNGLTWNWNVFWIGGDQGNQWHEESINLSNFNTSEVLIRFRVKTGNWQSDVAIDKISILGGPITVDGVILTNVANNGTHNFTYSIEGCDDYVNININEINAGEDKIACPSQLPFDLIGSPSNGVWSGNNIINSTTGTFDPSLSLGLNIVTYTYNNCVDTAEIIVVDTELQVDSLFYCINSGVQELDMTNVPRTPWNGTWSGNGIVNSNFPGQFNPNIAGAGYHMINYDANTCNDNLIIKVFPKSILFDTLICLTSPDFNLNVSPNGGTWVGNGIVNSSTGLFSPSQVGIGMHYIGYIGPNNCIDTFIINVYENPNLTMNGFNNYYCNKDTNIYIYTNPIGGILSGNGIINNVFNPSLAGTGYHTITYTYGSGNCMISIDTVIFVDNELVSETYQTKDSICYGELVSIGVNSSGGIGNYTFNWDNGLSNSFQHLVSPESTTNYIVSSSDGCSEDSQDTISIYVHLSFDLSFSTSIKKCYGELGYAKVEVLPLGNYSYLWNTNPISYNDSIYEYVNKQYTIDVLDENTKCIISDTITIPGYDRIEANFRTNTTNCLSITNNNELQLLDNSIYSNGELSSLSYWDFGDGTTRLFQPNINPSHIYSDTGLFNLSLILINNGNCIDTMLNSICVISDNKINIPNSFTPNGDNCNDEFYITGLGYFKDFNIKIYNRWGGDLVFESEEIIETDTYSDLNICNDNIPNKKYFKMGTWNGEDSELGVYVFTISYSIPNTNKKESLHGQIFLIR